MITSKELVAVISEVFSKYSIENLVRIRVMGEKLQVRYCDDIVSEKKVETILLKEKNNIINKSKLEFNEIQALNKECC